MEIKNYDFKETSVQMKRLIEPRSVAIIGATDKNDKVGGAVTRNALGSKYAGKIYLVNPNVTEMFGQKVYPNIEFTPDDIDVVEIIVNASLVPETLQQAAKKGVKGAIIISSGFAEVGKRDLQNQIAEIAQQNGIRTLGPNCFGLINTEKYYMPNQFANPANVSAHYETTAPEIWRDTDGKVTHVIAGMGTTGTLMGLSKRLKEYNPDVQIIGVQPEVGSAIQGLKDLKTQHIPKIWNENLVDEIVYVNPKVADETARLMTLEEGIFVGSSSGAIFYAAMEKAKTLKEGVVVCIAPDGGEKYLSTTLCDPNLCLACVKKYGIRCSYRDGNPVQKGDVNTL